jgi:hypothetical protein
MYRDRFSEFDIHSKDSIEDSDSLIHQKGILSSGGTVFGKRAVRSVEGSVVGEYGICSTEGGIRARGNIISWKGNIISNTDVESLDGEIYAGKIYANGTVSAYKITADYIKASNISCGCLRSKGTSPVNINILKQKKGMPEVSCYVGSWIDRLF